MKIDVRKVGTVAILKPEGRLTIGEPSESLKDALDAAIDGGAVHVVVDGSRVKYLDSSGIGELIAAMRRLMDSGGRLGIVSPSPKLRETLAITGLNKVFVVDESEEAILNQLSASRR